eukprot:sb/3476703/
MKTQILESFRVGVAKFVPMPEMVATLDKIVRQTYQETKEQYKNPIPLLDVFSSTPIKPNPTTPVTPMSLPKAYRGDKKAESSRKRRRGKSPSPSRRMRYQRKYTKLLIPEKDAL